MSCLILLAGDNVCSRCRNRRMNKKCHDRYMKYKTICSEAQKCVLPETLPTRPQLLQDLVLELQQRQNINTACSNARIEHSKNCIDFACVNAGHQYQIDSKKQMSDDCAVMLMQVKAHIIKCMWALKYKIEYLYQSQIKHYKDYTDYDRRCAIHQMDNYEHDFYHLKTVKLTLLNLPK